jgi:protein ImuB
MFATLHIPDLPVIAALRANPAARNHPCAVLAIRRAGEPQEKLPLLAINPLAKMAGLQTGWPLNRSLIRCPDLQVIPRDPLSESNLRDELIQLGDSIGPDLELTSHDAVTIDLSTRATRATRATRSTGATPLGDLTDLLDLLEIDGAEIWHALAATPDLSHFAARHDATRGRVIHPSDLAPLPLEILTSLGGGKKPIAVLELWGISHLGDFMTFPRQALAERLGAEAGLWHDILHGKSCRLLRLHRPPESFAQSHDCDDAIHSLDPLIFAIKRMLHALAGRLASRHLAASLLQLRLELESGHTLERSVRLPEPQSQVEGMLSPLQMWLESLKLDSPVARLHLDAGTTFAASAQREWFGRQMPQPERFAETLAKLDALLGTGRVGIPAHGKSFEVDAFALLPAMGPARSTPVETTRAESSLPLHRFRPPRQISVANETRHGKPWPMALLNGPYPGEIIDRRGPFPASGDWWRPEESWQRLEWDIQLASRHLLRLVFQTPDQWQLDGIYQ